MNSHDDFDDRIPGDKPSLQDQAERFSRKLSDSAQQIWLAGLGAFGRAQAEGSRVFDNLVKEGESIDARNREQAGDTPRWRDNVEEHLGEAREKAAGTWDKVEKAFDDRVQGVLKRLHIPTAEDVAALNARHRRPERTRQPRGGTQRLAQCRPAPGHPPVARSLTSIVAKQHNFVDNRNRPANRFDAVCSLPSRLRIGGFFVSAMEPLEMRRPSPTRPRMARSSRKRHPADRRERI
jgi:poly(hydroxyalkanoate) granule-associated protein